MDELAASKILVVDDAPLNIDILIDILSNSYDLRIATSGEHALRIVEEEMPDLILLDIMMPEINGYEVCRRLKSSAQTAKIPIIFITAKSEVEDEQKGFELGAVDYITKPISPPIVRARVKNHLLLKKQQDDLEKSISILEHEAEILRQKADIGLQAGALAHDINNILARAMLVQLIPDLLPDRYPEKVDISEYADLVMESLELGGEVCQGYTSYLRDIGSDPQSEAVIPLLQPVAMYLQKFKGSLVRDYVADLPPIYCKAYQIKRVVVNLLTNAVQAVESQDDQEITVKAWSNEAAKTVCLAVQDNGPGIPADVLPHIFEERFTTKENGTGLGLFMAKKIIENHQGEIRVDSGEGMGTTITVSLPINLPQSGSGDAA